MIYQVASGSSAGHRTRAECKKGRRILRAWKRLLLQPDGMFGSSPDDLMGGNGTLQVRAAYSMREQGLPRMLTSHRQAGMVFFGPCQFIFYYSLGRQHFNIYTKHNPEAMFLEYFQIMLQKVLQRIEYIQTCALR